VHVFEHDQAGCALQFVKRCRKKFVTARARAYACLKRTLSLAGDVVQRGERPRRGEVVAAAPQGAHDALPRAEFVQQHGLADARLAAYERDASTAAGRSNEPLQ
jgi:hypothetical protein